MMQMIKKNRKKKERKKERKKRLPLCTILISTKQINERERKRAPKRKRGGKKKKASGRLNLKKKKKKKKKTYPSIEPLPFARDSALEIISSAGRRGGVPGERTDLGGGIARGPPPL